MLHVNTTFFAVSYCIDRMRSAVYVANTVYKTNILIGHVGAAFPICIASGILYGITINFSNSVVFGWFIASIEIVLKAWIEVDVSFFISSSLVQVEVPGEQSSDHTSIAEQCCSLEHHIIQSSTAMELVHNISISNHMKNDKSSITYK